MAASHRKLTSIHNTLQYWSTFKSQIADVKNNNIG